MTIEDIKQVPYLDPVHHVFVDVACVTFSAII